MEEPVKVADILVEKVFDHLAINLMPFDKKVTDKVAETRS